jgi:hypothetical protein
VKTIISTKKYFIILPKTFIFEKPKAPMMKKLLLCLLAIIIGIFVSSNVLQSHSLTPPIGQACNSSGCHGGGSGAGISCTPVITVVSHYLGPQTNLTAISYLDPVAAVDTLTFTITIPGATRGGFQLSCSTGNFMNVDSNKTRITHSGSISYISHYNSTFGSTSWTVKWYPSIGAFNNNVSFTYSTVCDTVSNSGGSGGSCLPSCSGAASGTMGASATNCYCYNCYGNPVIYKKGIPYSTYYSVCLGDTISFSWNGGGNLWSSPNMSDWWGSVTNYSANNYQFGSNVFQNGFLAVVDTNWTSVNISYTYDYYCSFVHIQGPTNTISFSINKKPIIPVLSPVSLCSSKGVLLGANNNVTTLQPPSYYSGSSIFYQWTPSNSLDTSTKYRPIAKPLIPTTYTLKVTDWSGCSSKATQVVNFSSPSYSSATKTICSNQPILINHQLVSVAGVYQDTLINRNGCDSIVTLTLLVKNIGTHQLPAQTICDNGYYIFNNHKINLAGIYYDTLINYLGCDSILSLNLIVNSSSHFNFTDSICSNQNYFFNHHFVNKSGVYSDTFQNYLGCDSFVNLTLKVKPISYHTITQTICSNQFYTFNNHQLNQPGIYKDTLQNYLGCDSILTLTLTVLPNGSNLMIGICPNQSFNFNGNNLTTAGIYFDTLQNYFGCDSFITLHLNVNQPTSKTINQTICNNQTYNLNGTILNQSGIYYDTIQNHSGCDSFITLHLIVKPISSYSFNNTICSNQFYSFNNHQLFFSGIYFDTLINHNGCDSFITLHLTVLPTSASSFTKTICSNNPFLFNGHLLTQSGKYYDTLTNYLGCDSIITLHLIAKPSYLYNSTTLTVCEGSVYFYDGHVYTTNTQMYDTFISQLGCDSIVGIKIIAIPAPDTSVIQSGNALIAQAQHSSFYWYDCTQHQLIQNANDDTFMVHHSGSYAVLVKDSLTLCSDTSNCRTIVVSGVEEVESSRFSIYPNPTSSNLVIGNLKLDIGYLTISDVLGRVLKQITNLKYPITNVQVEDLPSGIYFIKATDTKGNVMNGKFIKE